MPKLAVRPLGELGPTGSRLNLKTSGPLPNFPEKIMVYKTRKPSVTKVSVLTQAKKLGISGVVRDSDLALSVRASAGDFHMDKDTGSFDYLTKDFEHQVFPLKNVLSDKEYKRLATDFLNKNGLLKKGAVFERINRDITVTTGLSGKETKSPIMVEAVFGSKKLNGFEWVGTGPKISVYFGENGKIIGASSTWREVEPFKEYPIISIDEAVKQIRDGKAIIYDQYIDNNGMIRDAKIVYLSEPIGYNQKYVIPYYSITYINQPGDLFTVLTPAIPADYLVVKDSKQKN
ncbi:MAG: hypothetical protein K6T91_07560 [Firmicutes bacterium]|nr:hypothetical protein [Bacillota bacterium]